MIISGFDDIENLLFRFYLFASILHDFKLLIFKRINAAQSPASG